MQSDHARTPPADHEIHQTYKRRMQRQVIGALTFVALIYFFILFPQQLLDNIQLAVTARRAQWLSLSAGAAGNVTLVWFLSFVLFAADSAFKGSNATAVWTRSLFASKAAVDKFDCTDGQASALWFQFFDTWGLHGSSHRNLLINSYSATYSARAVFYLQRALILFLLLGLLSMTLHWKLFATYRAPDGATTLTVQLLALSLFGAALAFIAFTNRLPKGVRGATGCWARVKDVFDRSRTLFEHDVLRHAGTLDEALERVSKMRAELVTREL
jgi:hypothetical protein